MIFYILLLAHLLLIAHGAQPAEGHECYRECDGKPKQCWYDFSIEWSYRMSKECSRCDAKQKDCIQKHCIPTNGLNRPIITVNGLSPGPSIHVCKNDIIIVNVTNHMLDGEGTTIHWHGIHQRKTPHMDGTGFITQCPIGYGNFFTYKFKASEVGTHYWHAHVGLQRQDGLYGSLVVRQKQDPHHKEYDYDLLEHSVLLTDWMNNMALTKFIAHYHGLGNNSPEHILINGKGLENEQEVFNVDQGKRYRFRIASNAGTNCPMAISVEDHRVTVIASDGHPVKPVLVDSFNIFAGERFDFILHANQIHRNYIMRVEGLQDCADQQQVAVVQYKGKDSKYEKANSVRDGNTNIELNPLNEKGSKNKLQINKLESLKADDINSKANQNVSTYYLAMDFYEILNPHFQHAETPQINHVSFKFPPVPLLTQHKEIKPKSMFYNLKSGKLDNNIKSCSHHFCEKIFTIRAKLGEIIELVLIDEGVPFDSSHPMHLHGYSFRVVAMEKLGSSTSAEEVIRMNEHNEITKNLVNAPLKDTVIVPDGGFTIIRLKANNPGWWFFHCHLEFHVEVGMAIVLHVGTDEDVKDTIPSDFPKCHDWSKVTAPANDAALAGKPPNNSKPKANVGEIFAKCIVGLIALACLVGFIYLIKKGSSR